MQHPGGALTQQTLHSQAKFNPQRAPGSVARASRLTTTFEAIALPLLHTHAVLAISADGIQFIHGHCVTEGDLGTVMWLHVAGPIEV